MTDSKPLTTSTDSARRADERLREEAAQRPVSEPTHNHAMGRDCCPHPDCVRSENRRVDKALLLSRARKLADGSRDGIADSRAREGLELADLVLRYLTP